MRKASMPFKNYQNLEDAEYPVKLNVNSVHEKTAKRNRFIIFLIVCISLTLISMFVFSSLVFVPAFFTIFKDRAPVILISMDGFRHDYIETIEAKMGCGSLPNFRKLVESGVRVKECTNAFPTITAPNHHTIVTGLYPETHGIVANTIWDTNYPKETYDLDNQYSLDTSHWIPTVGQHAVDPIWVDLQEAGYKVASMLWPYTDQPIAGRLPDKQQTEYATLNMGDHDRNSMRYEKRVDLVLRWLADTAEPVDFVMLYFEEPDAIGHAYGPNSQELANCVINLDRILGLLLDGLAAKSIQADIILTADHGMTQLNASKIIHVNECLSPDSFNYTWLSTSGFVYAKPGFYDQVFTNLSSCHPEMRVYKKNDVPNVENFRNAPETRSSDFVLIASPGWVMVDSPSKKVPIAGNHGYSVTDKEMQPILIFSGPSFNKNITISKMQSVDIYPTLITMFNIAGHPHNGSLNGHLGEKFYPHN